jgi:ABC-type multidrug transport system ATPase subunit
MAQVVLRELNKKYDEVHAVKDVNLTIRDKEFMVLVGPSGCGKTTTLRMVAVSRRSPPARSPSASGSSTICRPRTATSPWCSRTTRCTRT